MQNSIINLALQIMFNIGLLKVLSHCFLANQSELLMQRAPQSQLIENQVLFTCLSATPTPAIAWLCGPPWSDGNTAKSIFLSKSYLISGRRSGIKSHYTEDLSYCVTMYPGTDLKFSDELGSLRYKVADWQER